MSQENLNKNSEQPKDTAVELPKPRKRFCRVGLLTVACLVIYIIYSFLYVSVSKVYLMTDLYYGMCWFLVLIILLAISSLIKISLKGNELRGAVLVSVMLFVSCCTIHGEAYYKVPRSRQHYLRQVVCASYLENLETALRTYTKGHNDMLPAENWCDCLVKDANIRPESFLCRTSDSIEGESDCCLNQYAAGKKISELPADMVLLFEMDTRPVADEIRLPIKQRSLFTISDSFSGEEKVYINHWNQIGGPELLDVNRHKEGCNILFADGNQKYISLSELPNLRWDIEGKVSYTKPLLSSMWNGKYISYRSLIFLVVLGLAWVICSVYILIKFQAKRYWKFALALGILAAVAGLFFGNESGQAYLYQRHAGAIPGAVFGFLAGVCFAAIFAGRSNALKQTKTFGLFMTSVGMLTGILCSTAVHIVLMTVNRESNPFGIMIGIPFGVLTGIVLGHISAAIIRQYYAKPQEN